MKKKNSLILVVILCLLLCLSSCKENKKEEVVEETKLQLVGVSTIQGESKGLLFSGNEDNDVIIDEKFGGFFIDISIEDFNALGFTYGDSVDVVLSNGHELIDIPYYNGYYTKTNDPLICAYPGYAHIKVCRNNGDDLYKEFDMNESVTVTVTLNTQAKYIDVQEAMDTVYENIREAYDSDSIFANYRMMKGGTLKEGIFYRSASPVDNEYSRASYADSLMSEDKVQLVLNLSDNEEDMSYYMEQEDFNSPYAKSLYDNNKIVLLDMGSNYRADAYKQKVAKGLRAVIENEGPYLIHCVEGKDRTGFVAILIESLCNASYDELLKDYMITYDNYYHINQNNKKNQYDAIVEIKFNDMAYYLAGVDSKEAMQGVNMQDKASEYLLSAGMSEDEITRLIDVLTK